MTILYPSALFLLLLIVPMYFWAKTSFSHLSLFQRILSFVVRVVIVALLAFALAGIRFSREVDRLGVMFVVDASDSIPVNLSEQILEQAKETLESKKKDDLVGLVYIGREGVMELFPTQVASAGLFTKHEAEVEGNFTNLADGLKLAASSLPPGYQKRVVLVTDGAENLGDVLSEAAAAVDSGVELITVPLNPNFDDETLVEMFYAPSAVNEGETVGLRMVFSSTRDQNARVILTVDGEYYGESTIKLDEGKNTYNLPATGLKAGFHTFSVSLEPEFDTTAENNRAFAFSRVTGRTGVMIASDDAGDSGALDEVLNSHNVDTMRLTSQALPVNLPEWLSYDSVFLTGVPAHRLSESQMDLIATAVHSFGHGFVMVGGEDSFGPGGYYKTKIEEALPVTMDFKRHALSPNMAIILLVDSSGSMGITYNGYEKVALAREACINVVELAEPNDYYGVLTFDSLPKWVVRPEKNMDREAAKSKIRRIVATGGTEIYPAMVAAEKALKEIDAKVKHVIILSDGISAPGDFTGITKKLVDNGATVTTVGVGDDADLAFLEWIAKAGNGNSYFTNDPYDLPRIFTRETFMANKGTIIEKDFAASPASQNPLIEGIDWQTAPPLKGYVAVSDKPTAETPLYALEGDPLFSIWRYGLGKTAAFTSDAKNRWAAHWLGWDGYEKFWTALARSVSATAQASGYLARVELEGDHGVVTMEAIEELGASRELAQVEAIVADPAMNETTIPLRQIGVGKYRGEFDIAKNGTYMVNVVAHSANETVQAAAGLAVSFSPEYMRLGQDAFILGKLAALSKPLQLTGKDLFETGRIPQVQHNPAWELMVLIAIYLWLLDIAVRRMMWSREYFDMAADSWNEYMSKVRAARVRRGAIRENVSLGRLVERGRVVRSRLEKDDSQTAESKTALQSARATAARAAPARDSAIGATDRERAGESESDGTVPSVEWGRKDDDGGKTAASYTVEARRRMRDIGGKSDKSNDDAKP